ncbi:MAG: hypothetical protein ACYCZY_10115 [Lacisediminihabitans sp.]
MSEHLHATFDGGKGQSHRGRATNLSRAERIENEVTDLVDFAVVDLMEELGSLVDSGDVTEEEITEATKRAYVDITNSWKDYQGVVS